MKKLIKKHPECSLQSEPVCCNLQTACKLEFSNDGPFSQIAVCRGQIAESTCKLSKNPVMVRVVALFSDCTETPLYLRYKYQLTYLTSVSWYIRKTFVFLLLFSLGWLASSEGEK